MQLVSTATPPVLALLFISQLLLPEVATADVDLTINELAEDVLKRALKKIPDGASVTTSFAEDNIEEYVDISALPVLQEGDYDDNRLSGILSHNASDFKSIDGKLRTEVSWTVSSCICLNDDCKKTASIDMRGVRQIDVAINSARGDSPIIFHDMNGDAGGDDDRLPCLAVYKSPLLNEDEVDFKGCNLVKWYSPPDISIEDNSLHSPRFLVEDCDDGRVDNLRLHEKNEYGGRYLSEEHMCLGRPLTGMEVLPNNAEDIEGNKTEIPYLTLGNIIDRLFLSDFSLPEIPPEIPPIFEDLFEDLFEGLAKLAKGTLSFIAREGLDGVATFLRKDDFHQGEEFTDARLEEIIRVLDSFSKDRLLSSAINSIPRGENGIRDILGDSSLYRVIIPKDENDIRELLGDSSLYRDLIASVPETSPIQEILSGIVLLSLTAAVLGRTIGLLIAKTRQSGTDNDCDGNATLCIGVIGSLTAVIVELVAYYIRFSAEVDQNNFQESMVMTAVVGGGRFGGLAFLRLGRDFDPFIVTTFVIEVSDDSADYVLLLGIGICAAIMSCVISLIVSYKAAFLKG